MERDSRYELLVTIIRKFAGIDKDIQPNTQLEDDLSITGDDAVDLINEIGKKFGLDVSEFPIHKYFYPEPKFWTTYVETEKEKFTVSDLFERMKTGKL